MSCCTAHVTLQRSKVSRQSSGLNFVDDLVIRFLEWAWQPHKLRHIKRFRNDFDFHKHGEEFISIIDKYTNLDMDENYIDMLFTDLKNRGI